MESYMEKYNNKEKVLKEVLANIESKHGNVVLSENKPKKLKF